MERVAHLSNRLCFSREVTITRATNQPIAGADREHDLREVRRKGDYAINCGWKPNSSPGIVSNLSSRTLICCSSRSARKKQREADNNRQPHKYK